MRRSLPVVCLCLAALCLYPSFAGCGGSEEEIAFPYSFRIAEGNHLFVMGYHFTGEVVLTWGPGDSVRIEGMAMYPVPQPPPKEIPEERLQQVYAEVPFVIDIVEKGQSWREAVHLYDSKRTGLEMEAMRRYWEELEATGSSEAATRTVLDSLDRSLFDPDFDIEWEPGTIVVKWAGLRHETHFHLHQESFLLFDPTRAPEPISLDDVSAFLRAVAGRLRGDFGGIWMEVFSTTHVTLGGRAVQKTLDQIENSSRGSLANGPLFDRDVEIILERRGDPQ